MTDRADTDTETPAGRRANGALEAEILGLLQTADAPLTAGEVLDRFGSELAYSTVVTILSRLHAKEVLTRTARGRAFAYRPVTDVPGLAARRMRRTLEGEPDREAVLTRFVDDLSSHDEQLLRRLLGPDAGPAR
ncbi:BlaI/MecI/CopY family transcriptional regulator [Streptomyces sp. H10-C2]|uniref:BlaI/MecI/CopY family transcriptional regulator n=1 Tax=unclassified Streptomyces TaxID=2593676 RepID=UPI0024B9A0C7|nr:MULTISPECIES: BlaI/MecI/CopY family transcriptional regulator [unclassified Streptomyces]MDJ0347323.1 BlaI/MecI/CopY family transcriptional regulator [Streptomyces sp. PH10-H1]MDJ0375120.1 BlaI/MecI/CopY family transcriptional regulator [Streptomyces sp. H10-C2]